MSKAPPPSDLPKVPERSLSQSLFQIYYLGSTRVDRRCSSVVMPWIIEELKLKTQEMKFLWLTPGPDNVSFVADSGQELFSHPYTSILQCCIAVDGISFGYVCRSVEDNKYYCHVFQALTFEEAEIIMGKFKVHAREEVSIGSTISGSQSSDLPTKSSGLIFSSSLKHHPPESLPPKKIEEKIGFDYNVEFLGKFEVSAPSTSKDTLFQTIDKIVAKQKESQSKKSKRKKSISSLLRGKLNSTSSIKSSSFTSLSSDEVDYVTPPSEGSQYEDARMSLASASSPSLHSEDSSSSDVAIRVTTASPDPDIHSEFSMPGDDSGDEHRHVSGQTKNTVTGTTSPPGETADLIPSSQTNGEHMNGDLNQANGNVYQEDTDAGIDHREKQRAESMEFDTIPELSSLQGTADFQALSESSSLFRPSQKVRLVFSGLSMLLKSEASGKTILKKSIRHVACCAQGKKEPDYIAFTSSSREGDVKKYHCHLFQAENKDVAVKILESFKSAFVHALSFGMPAALCDSCPLRQLHNLCKSLEGVSTQVAQSRIQECLSSINEADFASIMKQYKMSEHADHEYTQIIILVGLIRQHFHKQQDIHTHPGTGVMGLGSSSGSLESSTSRLRLPALTRAKNALATSIENLRNRPSERGSRFLKKSAGSIDKPVEKMASDERASQSLNIRPLSPIFSRKTALDTLMAPIPTTPVKQKTEADTRRERTWSGFIHKSPRLSMIDSVDIQTQNEQKDESTSNSTDRQEPEIKTPEGQTKQKHATFNLKDRSVSPPPVDSEGKSTPVRKVRSQRPRDRLKYQRQSLTPPARFNTSSPLEKEPSYRRTHRRATSYALTHHSWRQEIFESVNTPTKPAGKRGASTAEFFEDFEIIDPVDQFGRSWRLNRGTFSREHEDDQSSPRTKTRKKWKDAIEQQIILNRMEKQNSLFQKASTDAELKRIKLSYSSPELDSKDSIHQWTEVLSQADETTHDDIYSKVLKGVPPSKRGEVWSMLARQYQFRSESDWSLPVGLSGDKQFKQLLEEETEFEHNIVVDIGRTFPSHPYFSSKKDGQSSLRNVLHAYAVADTETGYCQGLSFVAGIIQMHTKDDESAFELLYQLMTLYNYREMYFDNLTYLQMRLYQLSRLLHDFNPVLYQHLRRNDITPFFYAAPWFLTIFASQFPIAFTARVFDMLFCDGTDFVLKVVLSILQIHEESILECGSMETTCNYLKTAVPEEALEHADEIFENASKIDFGNRLQTFESEYHVMAELNFSFKSDLVIDDFPSVADVLKKQNVALIEQLAICHACNNKLESLVEAMQVQMAAQNQRILELEAMVMSTQSPTRTNQSNSITESSDPDRTIVAVDESI